MNRFFLWIFCFLLTFLGCITNGMQFKKLLNISSSKQQILTQKSLPHTPIHFEKPGKQNKPLKIWSLSKDHLNSQEIVQQLQTLSINSEIKNKIKDLLDTNNGKIANKIFFIQCEKEKVKDIDLGKIKKLNQNKKDFLPIWCLFGPPGVGKTALAKSIALNIGKKYACVTKEGTKVESIIPSYESLYKSADTEGIINAIKESMIFSSIITPNVIDTVDSSSNMDASLIDTMEASSSIDSSLLELFDPEENIIFCLLFN